MIVPADDVSIAKLLNLDGLEAPAEQLQLGAQLAQIEPRR